MKQTVTERVLTLSGGPVTVTVTKKNVKNINLRIQANGRVMLSVPWRVSEKRTDEFLRSHIEWLEKHLQKRAENVPSGVLQERNYQTGETFLIFGKSYSLEVVQGDRNQVSVIGEKVLLSVKNVRDAALRRKTFLKWLYESGAEKIRGLCQFWEPQFQRKGTIPKTAFRFRRMRSRWGSCQTKTGILTFNLALTAFSDDVISSVICHEYTHFFVPNHSKEFYRRLSEFQPDWKNFRQQLRKIGIQPEYL